MQKSWKDLDDERLALGSKISRADLARRAGVSESGMTRGISQGRFPRKSVREKVEAVLDQARQAPGGAP